MKIYHLDGYHKHEENSLRGIRAAINQHCDAIDIDGLLSLSGTWHGNHWGFPMIYDGFIDPLGRVNRHTNFASMTDAEIARLRTPVGNYHISKMSTLMLATAHWSPTLIDLVEPKFDHRFVLDEPWLALRHMAQVAFGHGWAHRVQVRALWHKPLAPARRAGFKAWYIGP